MIPDPAQPDPVEALRDLADDLEVEAAELNPEGLREGGEAEGLGYAVGRARERADRMERDEA